MFGPGGAPEPLRPLRGGPGPRKNLVRLIEAFARSGADRGTALVLAGARGWCDEEIFATVERLGLSSRVHFPGYVPSDELPSGTTPADLFAYPSLYEGFGLPVLEAQACGAPVLTSAASALPEAAGDGALLVDPTDVEAIADGLHRLLTDEPLAGRIASTRAGTRRPVLLAPHRCRNRRRLPGSDRRRESMSRNGRVLGWVVLLDIATIVVAFLGGYWVRYDLRWFSDVAYDAPLSAYLPFLVLYVVLTPIFFVVDGVYRTWPRSWMDQVYRITNATAKVTVLMLAVTFVFRPRYYSAPCS